MADPIFLSAARPAPRPDELSESFFQALKEERFVLQTCSLCRTWQLGRHRCLACGSTSLVWAAASGRGSLYAVAEVCSHASQDFNHGEAYNIAIVELEEGPQLYANIVNAAAQDIRIGMDLQLVYSRLDNETVVPVFEPTSASKADGTSKERAAS